MTEDTRSELVPSVTDVPAPASVLHAPLDPEQLKDASLRTTRQLTGRWGKVVWIAGVIYALYYLWTSQVGIQSQEAHRGYYWGVAGFLIFLTYPTKKRSDSTGPGLWDWTLAIASLVTAWYFVTYFTDFVVRTPNLTSTDMLMGALAIGLSLEMTRRTIGWSLTILASLAILYILFGPHFPAAVAHRGYGPERFISNMYTSFNGLYGVVAHVFATFVFLYIIFGAVLTKSPAARFLVELPYSMAATLRGGPAKVAIAVSAVMASVSGSPVANVMTTGNFSIPLMRKVGYGREFAGGVEAAASVGGQMLPPVMGAGAFLIAEFTQTPYTTIVLVSIIPALLYFLAVYLLIDFRAAQQKLATIPRSELESPLAVLRRGWYFFLPLVVVFTLILMRYSPAYAAFWGILAGLAVGFIPYEGERLTLRKAADALAEGSVNSLSIAGVVGSIGIIIGVANLTGIGLRFSDAVVGLAGSSLLLGLVLVTMSSWVLGLGLGVTASYIVVAVLAAPALTELGLTLLVAHLIIFWVSQDANLTPPVCLAAFAAASIAGGRAMRTGWESWKLGRGLYIVPFLMAYSPLVEGPPSAAAVPLISGIIGIFALTAGMSHYWLRPMPLVESWAMMIAGGLLIVPDMATNLIGLSVIAVSLTRQVVLRRRERHAMAVASTETGAHIPGETEGAKQ